MSTTTNSESLDQGLGLILGYLEPFVFLVCRLEEVRGKDVGWKRVHPISGIQSGRSEAGDTVGRVERRKERKESKARERERERR